MLIMEFYNEVRGILETWEGYNLRCLADEFIFRDSAGEVISLRVDVYSLMWVQAK